MFCIFCFHLLFYVLFVCKCVLYYCHRVSTQLQLTNISPYHIIYHIISYHIIYFETSKTVQPWTQRNIPEDLSRHRSEKFFHNVQKYIACVSTVNPLTPNDHYSGRTAPLTSKRCILFIYSTNIGAEYFKHGIYSPFFPPSNAVCFIILTYFVPVLFTFYIQGVLK